MQAATHEQEPTPGRIDELLGQMTLEEQVALLAGADFWRTVAIPRLDIPPLKVTDGPAGARGGGPLVGGKHTAAFPVGIAPRFVLERGPAAPGRAAAGPRSQG